MKRIEVWADWNPLTTPEKVGTLICAKTRGKEIFSFEYEDSWLKSNYKFQIDPRLQLLKGSFYANEKQENFGVFTDSSPDRWGRTLMLRREVLLARQEKRSAKTLMASDYLLGVYDKTRMGGLRFKIDGGPFLDDHNKHATPPWTSLRELEHASLMLEKDKDLDDPQVSKWLKLLVAPGSSLGGARPKASVIDSDDHLWIAKFPSQNDLHDVGGWEAVVYDLAKNCKINVAESKVQKFGSDYHTFLVKRFDRTTEGQRIHFASAMTLLERTDGDSSESGASYLEMVDFIISNGKPDHVDRDLEELWKRIVFSIAVSNSDDHLRNHGFILKEGGWILSPAYDINPNASAEGLSLNISWDSNALDYELAKEVAPDFRIDNKKANSLILSIQTEVKKWRRVAASYGISRAEQERMERAFRLS